MLRALTGTDFGRYQITAEIARGGIYDVYRATDSQSGRDVVLRVFGPTSGSAALQFLDFQRELAPLVPLDHRHIAKVYGFEDVERLTALATELIEAPTLADVIAPRSQSSTATRTSRALPLRQACGLAVQIVDAIVAARECGVTHANLSPSNISICDGVVRVRNFGLARLIPPEARASAHSQAGSRRGAMYAHRQAIVAQGSVWARPLDLAIGYISPEQWSGEPADARTDIWAFGCVLFEMLTGEPAFILGDADSTRFARGRLPHRWTDLSANLPAAIRVAIAGCVAEWPADRIGDISLVLPAVRDLTPEARLR